MEKGKRKKDAAEKIEAKRKTGMEGRGRERGRETEGKVGRAAEYIEAKENIRSALKMKVYAVRRKPS